MIITLAVFNVNAQSRVNKQVVQFNFKSEKIIEAKGWEQNKETGKWIENKNVIDDEECSSL